MENKKGTKSATKKKSTTGKPKAARETVSKKKGYDFVFSFDTTGSMYPVISQVRRGVEGLVQEIFREIDDVRIAIVAHGDYCDAERTYTIKMLDFSDDPATICDFINNVEATCGGDADECYELVLREVQESLSWGDSRQRALMMIGDSKPHSMGSVTQGSVRGEMIKVDIDWEKELRGAAEMGISILAVHALANYRRSTEHFYKALAKETGGVYLTLDNFSEIKELIMASVLTSYDEERLSKYVTRIRGTKVSKGMARNINKLTGQEVFSLEEMSKHYVGTTGLVPVPAGRFQIFDVPERSSIKQFLVEDCGVEFKTGRTFYELVKTETVQQYKEIILEDKASGNLYFGQDARKILKLLPQCDRKDAYASEKIKPSAGEYTVFIQSTSSNRALPEGTRILYEVPDYLG